MVDVGQLDEGDGVADLSGALAVEAALVGRDLGVTRAVQQQLGDGQRVHTWFIAFGGQPGQVPSVAVAVVVLNQPLSGTGGGTAAPIAQAMLSAALTNPAP